MRTSGLIVQYHRVAVYLCASMALNWIEERVKTMSQEAIRYEPYVPDCDSLEAAVRFERMMQQRRSVRYFSDRPVGREIIESIIRTAGSAPNGAHKQPWRFVAVQDADLKCEIMQGVEETERTFYERRASDRWLQDLEPMGTHSGKEYLVVVPWLIVVFKLVKTDDGAQVYYPDESVGIATGILIAAAQAAGLATLTHTPSPMKFLGDILHRPKHERPYMLIPVGYPATDCVVPSLKRKPLDEIMVYDRE